MARMAGSASWAFLGLLGVACVWQPTACVVEKPGGGAAESAVAADYLAAIGPEVVLPALEDFSERAAELGDALARWGDALSSGGGDAELAEAREAWSQAMFAWERLEVMQIGPGGAVVAAEGSVVTPGGEGIRDEIYSWPTINTCRVDQETAVESWTADGFFGENLVTTYGLDALEHLLFGSLETVCPGQVPPVSDGAWDALGEAGVLGNRAAYALAVADELSLVADELTASWSPDGGDFSGALAAAAAPYEDEQEALNAVFHALFYLETVSKDRKLARPLGLQDCGEASCPEDVELLESGEGAAAIHANLLGFQALYTGADGVGLDDVLADLGHPDLADVISVDLDAAIALAAAMDGPMDEAVVSDTARVEALYEAVKIVTDSLKGDLATVLLLEIPSEASGDND